MIRITIKEMKKIEKLIAFYGNNHPIVEEYMNCLFENDFQTAEKIWKCENIRISHPELFFPKVIDK